MIKNGNTIDDVIVPWVKYFGELIFEKDRDNINNEVIYLKDLLSINRNNGYFSYIYIYIMMILIVLEILLIF